MLNPLAIGVTVRGLLLDVCREEARTLLIVSHDDAVLAEGDRRLDMAELNAPAGGA